MAALLIIAVLAAAGAAFYARIFFERYVKARHEERRAVALFSRYVAQPVVEELLARKDAKFFEAREYYATIVCVRIRNFGLFAEALSPQETLQYLNEFYTVAGQAVQRHRGMIESLHGDTVTAVFGVLVEEQFQEERALRAALDIMRLIKAMETRWESQRRKSLTVGIGVNSGKIVAGDTGFQMRREFAIVGNPTQIAARLEAASEELNASIVASETTYDAVRDLFVAVPASSIPLRGLRHLQAAYIVRGLSKRASEATSLTLPPEQSFTTTVVRPAEAAVAPHPADVAQPTIAPETYVAAFSKDLRPAFSAYDDDAPALPEPPPVEGTYEDGQGPPMKLLP